MNKNPDFETTMTQIGEYLKEQEKMNPLCKDRKELTTKEQLDATKKEISRREDLLKAANDQNLKEIQLLKDGISILETRIEDEAKAEEMECEVTFLPVCSCGHVFKNLRINLPSLKSSCGRENDIPEMERLQFSVLFCPSCKRKIVAYKNGMRFNQYSNTIETEK